MGQLAGKTAIITGGGGDIGRTTATRFIAEGARVLLVARNEQRLQEVCKEIGSADCHYMAADICASDQVAACVRYATEALGGLDILLANAGISGPSAPIEDYPEDEFEHMMRVNVTGTWLCLKHALPVLKSNPEGGSVMITSSGAGLFGLPHLCGYVTSKHALTGLMRAAALECAEHKVRVNLICPGPVKSAMTDAIGANFGMSAEDYEKIVSETIPMGRYASLDEVADMMLFLAADTSRYCTGCIFPLDGGKAMH
jgi:NAD(P)-dependent dehydrogenase (short-subunit alcohol dehydrogenase family)